jgi:ATP-dependent Clp protease ATP-binding subunit ClpA
MVDITEVVFLNAVARRKRYRTALLNEIGKAHPEVQNIVCQVMEKRSLY